MTAADSGMSTVVPFVQWSIQNAPLNAFPGIIVKTNTNPVMAVDVEGNTYVAFQYTLATSNYIYIAVSKYDPFGRFLWKYADTITSGQTWNTQNTDTQLSIAVDNISTPSVGIHPNVYICYTNTLPLPVNTQVVVFSIAFDGNFRWKKTGIGSTGGNDRSPSISIDNTNSRVLLVWSTDGTATDPMGTHPVSRAGPVGTTDIVVASLDRGIGTPQWVTQNPALNTTDNDTSPCVAVDNTGTIYVAYSTAGAVTGSTNSGPLTTTDIVVFKLASTGTSYSWITQGSVYPSIGSFNTAGSEQSPSIALDPTGNIYVSYWTDGVIDPVACNGTIIGLFKLSSAGTLQWRNQVATYTIAAPTCRVPIALSPASFITGSDYLYLSYYTNNGQINLSCLNGVPGSVNTDLYVVKISPVNPGNIVWSQNFNTYLYSLPEAAFPSTPALAIGPNGFPTVSFATQNAIQGRGQTNTGSGATDIAVFNTYEISVPTVPLSVGAIPYDKKLHITWNSPSYDGGDAISQYKVEIYDVSVSGSTPIQTLYTNGSVTYVDILELVNTHNYNVRVTAFNIAGASPSASAGPFQPVGPPDAPSIIGITSANFAITVKWAVAANTGGSRVLSFTVNLYNAADNSLNATFTTLDASSTVYNIAGLNNGQSYYVTVSATNSIGTGSESLPSNPVTPAPYVPCLTAGTEVLTPAGYTVVENLQTGDLIQTSDGRAVPCCVFEYSAIATSLNVPVVIGVGSMGGGKPLRALAISPGHAINVGMNAWVMPFNLRGMERWTLNGSCIKDGMIQYWHIELPNYFTDHLVCNGAVVESFSGQQAPIAGDKFYKAVGVRTINGFPVPVYTRLFTDGSELTVADAPSDAVSTGPRRSRGFAGIQKRGR
jgi:hypothetical protein